MNDKEFVLIQKKIAETVKGSVQNPQAAISKLVEIKKDVARSFGDQSLSFYNVAAMVHEAAGDVWMQVKKVGEAEKEYVEMMKWSVKLYEMDKEKYDYRLAFSYFKRAYFYRVVALQCTNLNPTPAELTQQQKKIYEVTEGLYKNAIACTLKPEKKMSLNYAELHANVMNDLVFLYTFTGDYEKAISCGKDCIKLEKVIYEKMDDAKHAFHLANRMNMLATVYTFTKNVQSVMEMLEDSIFVLEEHEQEDPITFGVMAARNYMTLAGCYSAIKEEAEKAEEAYQQGLKRMIEVNKKTENRLVSDVIASYMLVGDYYRRMQKANTAKVYYQIAMKLALECYSQTKDQKYENIINRLQPLV